MCPARPAPPAQSQSQSQSKVGKVYRMIRGDAIRKKGTPVGVVYGAQGPALGSWEVQPPS
eukprot:1795541-Pyramimonas_sp.AAC.1